MLKDLIAQNARYILIGLGGLLAGVGLMPVEKVGPLADNIITMVGAAMWVGTQLWGIYVKWNTRSVPMATAERRDVPTVDAVTGAIER